jgi:hypothetical protein
MRYFIDTEFEENGRTIIPISLGIVAEDGRELYLINREYMQSYHDGEPYWWKDESSVLTPWLCENVCDKISQKDIDRYGQDYEAWGPIVHDFISNKGKIRSRNAVELWGYYAAYDHVTLAQIWGPMIALPEPIPMFTHEIMQLKKKQPYPDRPSSLPEHNALYDAKYQKLLWEEWTGVNN